VACGYTGAVPDAQANREKPSEARVVNSSLTPLLIAATFMTLFSVGMIGSSWGSAVSFIKLRFLISDASIGLLGSAQSLGGVLGNIATGFLERRFQAGSRMAIGVALFGAGCLLFFVSQLWFIALASVLVLGFGLGMFQVDYATLFSRGFGNRSGAVMNVMSTSFSFGSIVGPLVVVWLLERFGLMFLAVGIFAAAVILVMLPARDAVIERTSGSSLKFSPKVIGFVALCLFYVCAEQGVSFWMPSYLQSIGFDLAQSARVASWFWQALTVGRFLSIPLSLRFSSANLIIGCLSLSFVALLFAQIPSLAAPAFVAAGLFFAPVFPTGLVWINREYSSVAASSVFLVSGSVGALLIAPLLGVLKQSFGAPVIPIALAASALLALISSFWLSRLTKFESNGV
jgi:MFS transporter, FHS family, glucose/mannose:H+ symporter